MKTQPSYPLLRKHALDCTRSSQIQGFLALGDFMGWQTQVISKAPMLCAPVRLQEWLLVPAHQDNTPLPSRTIRRIRTIYNQGLRPQGFVVVHEAPMQLPRPKPIIPKKAPMEWPSVGRVFGGVAKVLGMLMLGGMLLPVGLLAGLVMLDPILIAVTQDDYWIEIDRWQV